jgi:hypothetical protein
LIVLIICAHRKLRWHIFELPDGVRLRNVQAMAGMKDNSFSI